MNSEWSTQRHILVKLLDFKDEKDFLKSSSKDQIIYKDESIRLILQKGT